MDVVISLGGSIIVPEEIDVEFLKSFKEMILEFVEDGNRAVIVTGGGHPARQYQNSAMEISEVSPEDLDWVGIAATKLNAELVRAVFGNKAYEKVINNPSQPIKTEKKIIIGSGWEPGCSSDKDTVILAVNLGIGTVINLSNIEYVYDSDPKENPCAKKFEKMTWDNMKEIAGEEWIPGKNVPFDPAATKYAAENNLKVVIMKGTNLENLKNFLEGKKFRGTIIS